MVGLWLDTQTSGLLTLSMVMLSPLSFLLQGCWENLGLLMSSFLFPNFVMVSGRISQRYLLIWDHFKVVSSAPALPRLCVSGPRVPGLPTPRRWSSALSVPLVLCPRRALGENPHGRRSSRKPLRRPRPRELTQQQPDWCLVKQLGTII